MNAPLSGVRVTAGEVWQIVSRVTDPELPFLPLVDLGVIRQVDVEHGRVKLTITPTYTGCPANDWIARLLRETLAECGLTAVDIELQLNPPWSTDWITPHGRALLGQHGIVPPLLARHQHRDATPIACPHCGATAIKLVSEFGATPCKSLYKCTICQEPFEAFKCL